MLKKILLILFFNLSIINAQDKTAINKNQIWLGYITDVKLNNTWSIWNDVHYASNNFFIARHGLTYHLGKNVSVTGGYAWLFLSTSFTDELVRKEHRPWAQFFVSIPQDDWVFQQRVRYEARFREKTTAQDVIDCKYDFTNRIRYLLNVRKKIDADVFGNDKTFVSLNNEVLLNFGKNINNNLDQYRISLFYGYPLKKMNIQLGYMYRYIPGSTTYTNYHGLVLWVNQNFDWGKSSAD